MSDRPDYLIWCPEIFVERKDAQPWKADNAYEAAETFVKNIDSTKGQSWLARTGRPVTVFVLAQNGAESVMTVYCEMKCTYQAHLCFDKDGNPMTAVKAKEPA